MSKPDPSSSTATAQEGLITIEITPAMEREFQRRLMFPELRLSNAVRFQGPAGVFLVSPSRAAEVLGDAKAMRVKGAELPRGSAKAYTALAARITEALRVEARRGAWEAPSVGEMMLRVRESFAIFEAGDSALYFRDDDEYGCRVTIVKGYGMHTVRVDGGRFVDSNGQRIEYMIGYVVEPDGGAAFFCKPYKLTRDDCKPSHIRLVAGLDVERGRCSA